MAANEEKELWDSYNGKGFAAEYSKYSVRSTADEAGNDIQATYATKDATQAGLDLKVDKVEGKGLSENDFTNADKANLDANTAARHTHANKVTLDKIPATDGHDRGSILIVGNNGAIEWADDEYEEYNINTVTVGGRDYPTVQIGNQIWMAENLDYADENIPVVTSSYNAQVSRAIYYDADESTYGYNGRKYGLLYNGFAIQYIERVLPDGWRIPTNTDFANLIAAVGSDASAAMSVIRQDFGGTDSTGLSIPLVGRYDDGNFIEYESKCGLYSKTLDGVNRCRLEISGSRIEINTSGNTVQRIFRSVRLVKDAN